MVVVRAIAGHRRAVGEHHQRHDGAVLNQIAL
jgi:hypothetical protein